MKRIVRQEEPRVQEGGRRRVGQGQDQDQEQGQAFLVQLLDFFLIFFNLP